MNITQENLNSVGAIHHSNLNGKVLVWTAQGFDKNSAVRPRPHIDQKLVFVGKLTHIPKEGDQIDVHPNLASEKVLSVSFNLLKDTVEILIECDEGGNYQNIEVDYSDL